MVCKRSAVWGIAVAVGLAGCAQSPPRPAEEPADVISSETLPQVVATTSVLCDLTEQIAQETVALTCLMQPGQDPHTYAAKPSDRKAIEQADLILYGGYDDAPALGQMLTASRSSAPQIAVYEAAVPEPLMTDAHDHDHAEEVSADAASHQEDSAAPSPDPHVWHSALNNSQLVDAIAASLSRLDAGQEARYQQNAARLTAQFAALNDWIEAQVATIPSEQRKLITTHDAFQYFADAYGFEVEGALSGFSTEEKPSARQLSELATEIKAAGVPAIFAETTADKALMETLARSADTAVATQPLYVEGPVEDGTVQQMLIANTCTIVDALGGRCDKATAPAATAVRDSE
ncbi:MAG: zinc ABC transporter substrate-binding protein [Leptolyngbya sp. SIO4C1]|nr:zinc ABC transporter substrate-binding protein [Leptolyngbya sp. SIO4C1]